MRIDTDIPVPTRDIVLVRSRLVPQSEGAARFTSLLINRESTRDKVLIIIRHTFEKFQKVCLFIF